mgnify:CR=1 FL=1
MESMRDTKRIMEREIRKGSTPLQFERIELDAACYQEIASKDKLTEVLQYLHRVGEYKALAGKTIINNVYTSMRGKTLYFTRARSVFEREKIYHQMLRQEKKLQPTYQGDCYVETAKCFFSLSEDEWEKCRMQYNGEDTFGFVLSNKYILGLYKCCREARRDFALDRAKHEQEVSVKEQQFMEMKDVKVLAHCLLLDDVMLQDREIEAKLYTIFVN